MLLLDELLLPRMLEAALAAAELAAEAAELSVEEAREVTSCQALLESRVWISLEVRACAIRLGLMLRSVTLARKMYRLELPVTPVRPTMSIQMMLAVVRMNGRATQKNLPTFPMAIMCLFFLLKTGVLVELLM